MTAPATEVVRRFRFSRVLVYGLLPGLAFLLTMIAGLLTGYDWSTREADLARLESVRAARDCAGALMSFQPDTIEKHLASTRKCLTTGFADTYTRVVNEMVTPYVKEKHVSAVAHLSAAAPVSASEHRAVVLVFVDQSLTTPNSPPTQNYSSIRIALERVAGRWLICGFDTL